MVQSHDGIVVQFRPRRPPRMAAFDGPERAGGGDPPRHPGGPVAGGRGGALDPVAGPRPGRRPGHGHARVRRSRRRGLPAHGPRRADPRGDGGIAAAVRAPAGTARPGAALGPAAGPPGPDGVPPAGLDHRHPPGPAADPGVGVRLRVGAGRAGAARHPRRLSGPGPRGRRGPGADRGVPRVLARHRGGVPRPVRPGRRRTGVRGPVVGSVPVHRGGAGPAGGRRAGRRARPRRVRFGQSGGGRHPGAPVPHRRHAGPAPPGGTGPVRHHRPGGRLRRRVPLRPPAGGRAAGARTGARGVRGHGQQDARPGPPAGVAGPAAVAGGTGPRGDGRQRLTPGGAEPAGAGRTDRLRRLRPARPPQPRGIPLPPHPSVGGPAGLSAPARHRGGLAPAADAPAGRPVRGHGPGGLPPPRDRHRRPRRPLDDPRRPRRPDRRLRGNPETRVRRRHPNPGGDPRRNHRESRPQSRESRPQSL